MLRFVDLPSGKIEALKTITVEKRWNLLQVNPQQVSFLQQQLGISEVLCKILVQRNILDFESAKSYFRPSLQTLHDPWLMKDMDKAVSRILAAFQRNEKILVFGDYDVDGTTAVACMIRFLNKVYSKELADFYIPNRYREGYGISRAGIDFAFENNFTLIISVDCGIKSVELVSYAKELGLDFIICDHHLPDSTLPDAASILNPKQQGCNYPYKELCGCGVAFKLISALAENLGVPTEETFQYLDLVATAIAADIVPITGENRVLAFHGLRKINSNPCQGIKALMKLAKVEKEFCITNVVFIIAPRVNAAGRMDDARKAVQMFISDDPVEAMEFAEMLHSDNHDRREADSSITEQALSMIDNNELLINRTSTVLYKEDWHKGVVGIVASRLIEKYYRPTVVLTRSGDVVAGSARSVTGFNLYEAIHACREHLIGYGGHFAAAGLTMLPSNIKAFSDKFEETVFASCEPHLLIPEIVIDAEISFDQITSKFYRLICQAEPFGPGNMRPVFISRKVSDTGFSAILKEQHIRFVLKQNNVTLAGIGFTMAEKFPLLQQSKYLDIVFTIDENEWKDTRSIQLRIIDLKPSSNIELNLEL